MKSIVLAAAIAAAVAVASPALAKSTNVTQHVRASQHVMNANTAFTGPDPYGAYVDGREIGRDPDPSIRSSLRDEYYELQGN
jgi:hypothetical protein